jgi:hypothetical protein
MQENLPLLLSDEYLKKHKTQKEISVCSPKKKEIIILKNLLLNLISLPTT